MASSSRADITAVSGPASMAKPPLSQEQSSSNVNFQEPGKPKKKKRGGKKHKRTRRQSFAAQSETTDADVAERPSLLDVADPRSSVQDHSFYRIKTANRSNTSLESEALLDHREQGALSRRRQTAQTQGFARPSMPANARQRASQNSSQAVPYMSSGRSRLNRDENPISEGEDEEDSNDRTPLLGSQGRTLSKPKVSRNNSQNHNYGGLGIPGRQRRQSKGSMASSKKSRNIAIRGRNQATVESADDDYDVNNPPSIPSSPTGLGSLNDVMVAQLSASNASDERGRDAVITIDSDDSDDGRRYSSSSNGVRRRRGTMVDEAQRDVCYPADAGMSEIAEEDVEDILSSERQSIRGASKRPRRREKEAFPKLWVLDEWVGIEKEQRIHQDMVRAKKVSEPVLVAGRLRPGARAWQKEEDDAPFRFTYFNESFDSTIHARTISDLLDEDVTFKDLFQPDPFDASDSEEDEDGDESEKPSQRHFNGQISPGEQSQAPSRQSIDTVLPAHPQVKRSPPGSGVNTGTNTPAQQDGSENPRPHINRGMGKQTKIGTRPVWWLDILQPSEDEMRAIGRAFGIHQLTLEDIHLSEEREKVELFQSYYFVNYRSFEQDINSEDYLEPINIYAVVFRDFVITFHHQMTPHMNNVRRRIRQLYDYMSPTADWISYALIDDVTDVYAPLVQQIEKDVDDIDDEILYMHQNSVNQAFGEADKGEQDRPSGSNNNPVSKLKGVLGMSSEKESKRPVTRQGDMGAVKAEGEKTAGDSGGDMLRRVGECRKKVMGLYRLLGNKADVIKGFAKRCNEHWEVAPRSEIGLYLGDIQDHIVTMTGNLSHYENLLSRAHSNYLAQINIRMNERAEQTADVLGKLTVLGTIVLPMNIITGMWGMNVWVPGQEYEGDLTWFWCITAGLFGFGFTCYFVAKKVYGIV